MPLPSLTSLEVNPNAPTFPPATIDHAVYPWKDPTSPTPPMNEVDSNALCYLIMTGNDQPPVPPQLPYSGTWVDADKSEPYRSAIFCMNSTQYWSSWFLPLVQVINLATQIQAEPPYFVPKAPETCLVGLSFTPATCTAHPDYTDKYYAFQPVSPDADNNAWTWTANSDLLATNNSIQSGGNSFSLAQYGMLAYTPFSKRCIFMYKQVRLALNLPLIKVVKLSPLLGQTPPE
jgi:hypothetical protein